MVLANLPKLSVFGYISSLVSTGNSLDDIISSSLVDGLSFNYSNIFLISSWDGFNSSSTSAKQFSFLTFFIGWFLLLLYFSRFISLTLIEVVSLSLSYFKAIEF